MKFKEFDKKAKAIMSRRKCTTERTAIKRTQEMYELKAEFVKSQKAIVIRKVGFGYDPAIFSCKYCPLCQFHTGCDMCNLYSFSGTCCKEWRNLHGCVVVHKVVKSSINEAFSKLKSRIDSL